MSDILDNVNPLPDGDEYKNERALDKQIKQLAHALVDKIHELSQAAKVRQDVQAQEVTDIALCLSFLALQEGTFYSMDSQMKGTQEFLQSLRQTIDDRNVEQFTSEEHYLGAGYVLDVVLASHARVLNSAPARLLREDSEVGHMVNGFEINLQTGRPSTDADGV